MIFSVEIFFHTLVSAHSVQYPGPEGDDISVDPGGEETLLAVTAPAHHAHQVPPVPGSNINIRYH